MSSRPARSQAKRSPRSTKSDADPILKAIVRTAARLCDASYCHLYLVDGGFLRNVAKHGWLARSVPVGGGFPIGRGSVAGRAVHDRRTVHVRDLKVARRQFENAVSVQRAAGLRTMLATPLLRDGQAIGALVVLRRVVRPFTAHQIALLKSFAEQATIALENARLSRELAARNSELTEALGRETATGEILGVISRSPTDIEPVLSAVAESAARLCHAYDVTVFRLEGDVLRLAAHHGPVPVSRAVRPAVRTPHPPQRAPHQRGRGRWRHPAPAHRGRAVHRSADRSAPDLRGPGRDRHRERAAFHGAGGAQPGA